MNDIDRRIAELKGWRPPTLAECERLFAVQERGPIHPFPPEFLVPLDMQEFPPWNYTDAKECCWSTSDARALELVDELGLSFQLQAFGNHCSAVIDYYGQHHQGVGDTRPEAICRAYIAAMEWMKARKEG